MRPFRASWWRLALTLTLVALGFLVATQVRASRVLSTQVQVPTRNVYAMATLLREERQARQALEEQVMQLRKQLENYEGTASQGRNVAESMTKEVETLRTALGLKAMQGAGVTVRLDDPQVQVRGGPPVVVTYQDVVSVINELWAAGAEAIAINGQRIMATTGFSQVSGTVVVNLQRLSQPFVIAAIGDPATLESALNIRGGMVEGLRALGLRITIKRQERLVVPASKASITFEYAQPAP
jgi:uncharacterized protein YlxW (UPF0749 family)